jgi:hypothetical protein
VHVIIIGLTKRAFEPLEKRLFSYDDANGDPVESKHRALSPYLFDASNFRDRHLVITDQRAPIGGARSMRMGSKIVDGGHYIFDQSQREVFLSREPSSSKFMCPLMGSEEYINGGKRWILNLDGASPVELRSMPLVLERIAEVKRFRLASKKAKTRELAETPTRFEVMTIPHRPYLVVPEVSSERRDYIPIGWLKPPTIPSNLVQTLLDADLYDFGILTSRMHMAWLRNIGGRLESRYRYSIGIVYNTFPWPEASETQKEKIRALAQGVLDARAKFPDATLADLYDPDSMPPELRKAHRALDAAVDSLYKRGGFASDRERVEHLFALYEKLVQPLAASAGKKSRRASTQ